MEQHSVYLVIHSWTHIVIVALIDRVWNHGKNWLISLPVDGIYSTGCSLHRGADFTNVRAVPVLEVRQGKFNTLELFQPLLRSSDRDPRILSCGLMRYE